jgi:hypothetical protein
VIVRGKVRRRTDESEEIILAFLIHDEAIRKMDKLVRECKIMQRRKKARSLKRAASLIGTK